MPLKKLLSEESVGLMMRRRDKSHVRIIGFFKGLGHPVMAVDEEGTKRYYTEDGCFRASKHVHDFDITNYTWKKGF